MMNHEVLMVLRTSYLIDGLWNVVVECRRISECEGKYRSNLLLQLVVTVV